MRRLHLVVIAATLALVAPMAAGPLAADAAPGPWTAYPAASISGFSCGSMRYCTAVGEGADGPVLYGTADAGASWSAQTVPSGTPQLSDVACSTPTTCLASVPEDLTPSSEDEGFVTTTDAGAMWTTTTDASSPPIQNEAAADLTCLSPHSCYAVTVDLGGFAGVIVRSTNDGASWSDVPGGTFVKPCVGAESCPKAPDLDALSCASDSALCMAVGHNRFGYLQIATTASSARHFVELSHVPKVRTAFGFQVSCGTAHTCMVTDWEQRLVLVTSDGGRAGWCGTSRGPRQPWRASPASARASAPHSCGRTTTPRRYSSPAATTWEEPGPTLASRRRTPRSDHPWR